MYAISQRHITKRENLKHAQLLYEGLTKRGLKVWWDRVPIIIRGQK